MIITSLLSSAQGKASISCQRVWVHKLVFSKVQPIVRTGLFITSLCDSMPTHCFTSWWFCYYRWGSQVWDWWQKIRLESKRRVWLIKCCQRICIHVHWELQRTETSSHTHNPHAYMETRWDFTRIEYSCQSDKWKTTACVSVIRIMSNSFTDWMVVHQRNVSGTLPGAVILWQRRKSERNTHEKKVKRNFPSSFLLSLFSVLLQNNLVLILGAVSYKKKSISLFKERGSL